MKEYVQSLSRPNANHHHRTEREEHSMAKIYAAIDPPYPLGLGGLQAGAKRLLMLIMQLERN